jgi:hypothetical protein
MHIKKMLIKCFLSVLHDLKFQSLIYLNVIYFRLYMLKYKKNRFNEKKMNLYITQHENLVYTTLITGKLN